MWNPWGTLKKLTHIVVIWARPHPMVPAATDGMRRVWIDPRATQVERRCLLAHELVHLERGHIGCQPPAVERDVRAEVARRLIPPTELAKVIPWSLCPEEAAEELHVTREVLADRLQELTQAEKELLAAIEATHAP